MTQGPEGLVFHSVLCILLGSRLSRFFLDNLSVYNDLHFAVNECDGIKVGVYPGFYCFAIGLGRTFTSGLSPGKEHLLFRHS